MWYLFFVRFCSRSCCLSGNVRPQDCPLSVRPSSLAEGMPAVKVFRSTSVWFCIESYARQGAVPLSCLWSGFVRSKKNGLDKLRVQQVILSSIEMPSLNPAIGILAAWKIINCGFLVQWNYGCSGHLCVNWMLIKADVLVCLTDYFVILYLMIKALNGWWQVIKLMAQVWLRLWRWTDRFRIFLHCCQRGSSQCCGLGRDLDRCRWRYRLNRRWWNLLRRLADFSGCDHPRSGRVW